MQQQPQKPKKSFFDPKVLGLAILILLIGLVVYGILNNSNGGSEQNNIPIETEQQQNSGLPIWLLVLCGLGIVAWVINRVFDYNWLSPKRIKIDEFVNQIHIPRLIRQGYINGIYNDKLKHLKPHACKINIGDARPLSETGIGSRTFVAEIEFYNDLPTRHDGVHVVMVNLDNNKDDLEHGDYAIYWHTHLIQFIRDKSYRRKLPFVTPEDEQMKMLQLLGDSGHYDNEEINQMMMQRYNVRNRQPTPSNSNTVVDDDRLYNNEEIDSNEQRQGNYAPVVNHQPYNKKRGLF